MDEVTPMEQEALITFRYVYMAFCIWMYTLRIYFPKDDILLAFIDIPRCFHWPRIHPDLAGAFDCMVGPLCYAANAMVFDSVTSATAWEPFRQASVVLALSYFGSRHLKIKHKQYLDMMRWAEDPEESVLFVPASSCSKNKGVINDDGSEQPSQHNIYVDNNMVADIKRRLIQALVAAIDAIFVIMGIPNLLLRPCAVALDKWLKLNVHAIHILLGLYWNICELTVDITPEFRAEMVHLLNTTSHDNRESFNIK